MGKIIHWVHASVDGFIDGPAGEFFGRPVWQMMVGFWPNAESMSDDAHVAAFAPFWRATPKIVFSRGYPGDEWAGRPRRSPLSRPGRRVGTCCSPAVPGWRRR
jgi:hypothetical protein